MMTIRKSGDQRDVCQGVKVQVLVIPWVQLSPISIHSAPEVSLGDACRDLVRNYRNSEAR